MSPTNGQIIAEARRRAKEQNWRMDIEEYVIEVVREGWTPPEPVDPDVLAFREWLANDHEADGWTGGATLCRLGRHDGSEEARAYLAGARMAREQERERADMPIRMAEELVGRLRSLLHSLPAGVHDQLDVKWGLDALCRAIEAEIAKYRGEA